MQLLIHHSTIYRYNAPLSYSIQQLRLTPRNEKHQQILQWQLRSAGDLHATTDAYGNTVHTLTVTGPQQELLIQAQGRISVINPPQGRISDTDALPPAVFTLAGRYTAASPAILELSHRHLNASSIGTADALQLAQAICSAVRYRSGATEVSTSADDALQLGLGVCQDHAHLFLACCHVAGVPARYVSGYIDPVSGEPAASHAWVDVWVQDASYHGWVSIDVTHACLMNDRYCRLAVGRDYDSAAPVRGIRRGGGEEVMTVRVQVIPQAD